MYLMTVTEFNFEDCLTAVRHCRELANPNYGFRMQLRQYEGGKMKEVLLLLSIPFPPLPSPPPPLLFPSRSVSV